MPIYEYRCTQCGHKLDALQKFSDAPLTTCPACGKETLAKQLSAAGFQLKGSGWYQTDFRGGSKPAEKSDGAKGEAKDAGKGESGKSEAGESSAASTTANSTTTASTPAANSAPASTPSTGSAS